MLKITSACSNHQLNKFSTNPNIHFITRFLFAVTRRKKDRRRIDHSNLSLEELMETGTFKKFHKSIEFVIESAEDVDLNMLNSSK